MKFTKSNSCATLALTTLTGILGLGLKANAQSPAVLYTWPSGLQDWFKNFGAASTSATLGNSGGALQIIETSATAGGSQAFSDGFNTIRDASALFPNGGAGGLDLTGLSALQFDISHNGSSP